MFMSSLIKTSPLLLSSSVSDVHRKDVLFEWPEHMNINHFLLTNQVIASLSWNSCYLRLWSSTFYCCINMTYVTSITKELLLQQSESVISLVEKARTTNGKIRKRFSLFKIVFIQQKIPTDFISVVMTSFSNWFLNNDIINGFIITEI